MRDLLRIVFRHALGRSHDTTGLPLPLALRGEDRVPEQVRYTACKGCDVLVRGAHTCRTEREQPALRIVSGGAA